jgi:phosphopantothenoylcysteine decarboxylase/phosphopantothenate--cysteine ligase
MKQLSGKRILLGITGGIAAYKSADLTRRLRESGADVQVVMTSGATEFVGPLTFQALSGRPVRTQLLDPEAEAGMGHIELDRWADVVLVAPASANFIARLAQGQADDLLTTLCLATEAPLYLAPAMNRVMWSNAATQANVETLTNRHIHLFGPAEGDQACGETGAGRMLEPLELRERLAGVFNTGLLPGTRVVITAGPTREALDPVRFLSNHSSGRMGFSLAEACREAGASVTLVAGPVNLVTPSGVERVDVESAEQMYDAVMQREGDMEIFIGTAAVADYRPQSRTEAKIKKDANRLQLSLVRNPDILAQVAKLPAGPFTVGFAAETHDLEKYARRKLQSKGVDMICANWVGREGTGFHADCNALEVLWSNGRKSLPTAPKGTIARQLIELVASCYQSTFTTEHQCVGSK